MAVLEPVIAQLLVDGFMSRPRPSAKIKAYVSLMMVAGLMATIGVVYLMMALHAWLLMLYPPATAAALTGGLALVLSGISAGTFAVIHKKQKARKQAEKAAHHFDDSLMAALG